MSNVHVDGTGVYINSSSARIDKITGCEFTWVDWVIFQIAKCDKTNFCIPYKLLQVIQDYPGLNIYLRQPGYDKKNSKQQYNRLSDGAYNNIITQNILARSSSSLNKDKMEYATLNNSWIASLIAITPYVINTLVAYKSSMHQNVTYNRNSVTQCLTNLIDALTMFYDDIGNYAPFMPFMTDSVQISSSRVKPHIFGELLSFINNNNLCNMDSSDFIKLEWANMWFFNGIDNISFPDYKNKDRFEWIKEFASDKVNNGTFRSEFDTTIQTLGRNVWAGLIAKTSNYNVDFKNVYRELDEIIIKTINIMSECDTDIIQKYVNNIIDEYTLNMRTGISGQGLSLSGGNEANKTETYDIPENLKSFADRLTKGLVVHNTVNQQLIDYSNVESKPPASILKLYYYYPHIPKDINRVLEKVKTSGGFEEDDLRGFKSLKDIVNSKGVEVISSSLNSLKTNYFMETGQKISGIETNIRAVQSEIEKYEREFVDEINEVMNRELRNGIDSDIVKTFVTRTVAAVGGAATPNTWNDRISQIINNFVDERSFRGDFLNNFDMELVNITIRVQGANHRLFDNTVDNVREVKFTRYVEKVIGYYQLAAIGLVFGLSKYVNKCKSYITNLAYGGGVGVHADLDNMVATVNTYFDTIVNNIQNMLQQTLSNPAGAVAGAAGAGAMPNDILQHPRFNNAELYKDINNNLVWRYVNKYIDNSSLVIKQLIKLLTIPLLNGKCNNIIFKLPYYDMDYAVNSHIQLGNLAAIGNVDTPNDDAPYKTKLAFCLSIYKTTFLMAYLRATNSNDIPIILGQNDAINNEIDNAFNPATPVLNTLFTNIERAKNIVAGLNLHSISNEGSSEYTGKITLTGGKYSNEKIDVILAIALGISKSIKNRSIYIDNKQRADEFPLIFNYNGELAPREIYLYKYLYNPNLCSLFNKTTLNNTEYVISNIAQSQLFISDPRVNISRSDLIDLNKVDKTLSNYYSKILDTFIRGAAPPLPAAPPIGFVSVPAIRDPFYNQFKYKNNVGAINSVSDLERLLNAFNYYTFAPYHDVQVGAAPNTRKFVNIENKEIEIPNTDLKIPIVNLAPTVLYAADVPSDFVPLSLKVNYDNSETVIKPKTHTVQIDDKMFAFIPYSKALSQHLFSPQKDIYNATLININQLASPTILQDINDK